MTRRELSQLFYLNREVEYQGMRLRELESAAAGHCRRITGLPGGNGISDRVGRCGAEIADLSRRIDTGIHRCWQELFRLSGFIDSVEDSQMRQILSMRYIGQCSWDQIAIHLGGGNTADGVRKAHDRYLSRSRS